MAYIEIFNVQRIFIGFYWFLFKSFMRNELLLVCISLL